ncbi:MAG: hypothetical protein HYV27_20450 [Candidatus Hydrogenedentes bacterium]|nr:hypothetical protein [Candidatus Hydrogenedentota bacterium]
MQSEDRIIHFAAELIHKPRPNKKEDLQRLYFELSQSGPASYDNTDFSFLQQVRFQSRRGAKSQSIALFLPDRLLIVEEWADIAMSDFLEKVRTVGEKAMQARGIDAYLAHTATVRSTFALTHFDDARVFLLDHACGQEGRLAPHFSRPISVGGLRLVFPETADSPGSFQVNIESFRHSRNEVFVEAKGVFSQPRIAPGEIGTVLQHIKDVRHFVSNSVFNYLNQFDKPQFQDG